MRLFYSFSTVLIAHKRNWSGFFSEKGTQAAFAIPCDAGRVTLGHTSPLSPPTPPVSAALEGFRNQYVIGYSVVDNA